MDESFRVRVDKVFGSLSAPSAASSSLSSLWCLTEDEIDSNEKSGKKEVPGLFDPSSFPDIRSPENEPGDLSVDGDEGRSILLQKPTDYNDEEWEIKSSIGMDSTLDMEDEEDENDKLAVRDELLDYTKDVNDYETEADEWEELPTSLGEREKDPRANLIAAKLRLKEDAEAVQKLNSLHVSEVHEEEVQVGFSDDNALKPILKRKENQVDFKLQKRVRFSSDVIDGNCSGGDNDSVMETSSPNEQTVKADYPTGIPDYMRNPSKYIRYTFESGEVDEESNRKAYMDFLNMIRRRDEPVEDRLVELPSSVAFVPKRKPMTESKVENVDEGYEGRKGAIAVGSIEDDTVSAMEEDELETTPIVTRKSGRQYRTRAKEDEE